MRMRMNDGTNVGQTDGGGGNVPPQDTPPVVTPPDVPRPQVPPGYVPQSRVDEIVAQRHEERRARERAEEDLTTLKGTLAKMQEQLSGAKGEVEPAAPPQRTEAPPQYSAEDVREAARVFAAQERFNEKCNEVAASGREKYSDFNSSIESLQRMSPFDPQAGAQVVPTWVIEAAMGTDAPHEVLYELGRTPQAAERIMSLPPVQAAVEISKFALGKRKPGAVSAAPPPVGADVGATDGAAQVPDLYDKKLSTADWMAQREKTRKTRR